MLRSFTQRLFSTATDVLPGGLSQSVSAISAASAAGPFSATFNGVRTSPRKLSIIARAVRGMTVRQALVQMQFSPKKHAETMEKAIKSAAANSGLDDATKMGLIVQEAYVNKGQFMKRLIFHARGRTGHKTKPSAHLTVKLGRAPEVEQTPSSVAASSSS
jgi:large subunit ribosomal protein L22